MPDSHEQSLLQECTTCGALIDVFDEEPFALMHCPTCGAALRVRRQFGPFELQEVLGAGGMGAVYRALDTRLNRAAALKLLRREYSANPEFIKLFEHEAAITASITHPNVVKVYSTGTDHGLIYIAMELVDKGSLDDLMTLQGRVPEAQVLEVGMQIAQGLRAAQQRGLIHRDVKPGNILFADAHHAKIVDFGLAVLAEQAGNVGGEIWGTPYYVAPEKLDQKPEDFRSDMYSLGATLFHAVAGRPPYEADNASLVALKHLKSQVVSLQAFAPDVTSATAYVINRTLLKEPDQRYASYDELIEHLEYARTELLSQTAIGPRQKNRLVLEDDKHAQMMSWVTLGMVATLVLGGAALWFFSDAIFDPDEVAPVVSKLEQGRKAAATFEPRYETARRLMIDGKFDEAAAAFQALDLRENVPQPLRNWITSHAALSCLFAGRLPDARTEWERIITRGPYSNDPAEAKLANFFVVLAEKAKSETPEPAAAGREFDKETYEAFALLVLALKNWELGSFEEAGPLLRQYQSASPPPPNAWIPEYKNLTSTYLSEFTDFRGFTQMLSSANTPEKRKAALPTLVSAAKRLKSRRLNEKALEEVGKLEAELQARVDEESKEQARKSAADELVIKDAKNKVSLLLGQYRFAEAQAVFNAVNVTGEKARRDREILIRRCDALSRFKSLLVQDVTAGGYALPLQKRNGTPFPGGANRATDTQIEVKTPYGSFAAPWTDLAPESIITMARSFIRPTMPPDKVAERKWHLGIFAQLVGKAADARVLLEEAAQATPEYREQLAGLLEVAGA